MLKNIHEMKQPIANLKRCQWLNMKPRKIEQNGLIFINLDKVFFVNLYYGTSFMIFDALYLDY